MTAIVPLFCFWEHARCLVYALDSSLTTAVLLTWHGHFGDEETETQRQFLTFDLGQITSRVGIFELESELKGPDLSKIY